MKIETDQLIPLNLARHLVPLSARTGRPLDASVLRRWAKQGLLAGDGTLVKLKAVKAGNSLCTSQASLDEFFFELTRRAGLTTSAPIPTETGPTRGRSRGTEAPPYTRLSNGHQQ